MEFPVGDTMKKICKCCGKEFEACRNAKYCRGCNGTYYERHKDKALASAKKWQADNPEKKKRSLRKYYKNNCEKAKKYTRKQAQMLSDSYVAQLFHDRVGDIPKDLIDAKRASILIKRHVRSLQ